MAFHNIPFYQPVAGVFVFARLGGKGATVASDLRLWTKISAAGVAISSGAGFHEKQPGWFRITFAVGSKDMVEGLRRVEKGMGFIRQYKGPKGWAAAE